MSVVCAVQFADHVITRMTAFDYRGDALDIGRAIGLACAAYEARMKCPPPSITIPEMLAGAPDIVLMQYQTAGGKTFTITCDEYRRMALFASMFPAKSDGEGGANPEPTPQRHGRRRRPRVRSMAEWEEQNRARDLRRLARASPALRRELLKTMDCCPCCEMPLGGRDPASGSAVNGQAADRAQAWRARISTKKISTAPQPGGVKFNGNQPFRGRRAKCKMLFVQILREEVA